MSIPPGQPYAYQPPQPLSPSDEKMWSTLTHVAGIFVPLVAALIAYLVLKDRGPFVRAHTATALNFHISLVIYGLGILVLSIPTFGLATFLVFPLSIVMIIFCIIAAVASNKGEFYKYPITIEFVR